MAKELKTDDPEAKEGELCAAPWVLLERHCRRHRGKEAARDVFARTADLRKAKKIDARIYEGHAVVESRANNDKLAARRVFELGLGSAARVVTEARRGLRLDLRPFPGNGLWRC